MIWNEFPDNFHIRINISFQKRRIEIVAQSFANFYQLQIQRESSVETSNYFLSTCGLLHDYFIYIYFDMQLN